MDTTNHKSIGHAATQPAHVQIRLVLDTIKALGDDIRKWSVTARSLRHGGNVDVEDGQGNLIGTAPKLALLVVSTIFRQHLEDKTDSTKVKISISNIDNAAVAVILKWVNTMIGNPTAKHGIHVPGSNIDLIKVRYAAIKLGMGPYVRHFGRAYQSDLRYRTPTQDECFVLERLATTLNDEFLVHASERLGYLRRTRQMVPDTIAALAAFLESSPYMRASVQLADNRASLRSRRF
ncbi:hypothetical protein HBI24_235800 [Parastagonospora nodorum]|nr:hypothetical protein HBH47_223540 [Parastagonospora nodorum]KAH4921661.1 hypothetical protein HBI79_184210 [Parastagonospora nodorum]KAH5400061.1 hypothetical protein HBI46_238100 [Parastagonospora nodorum]KAH5566523.1 hypothetical protein HBI24_235800 [Parastagonospora nodorum]KAH5763183.1 hypothetical protein HBI97_184920 [Parastagonospora nodorum]